MLHRTTFIAVLVTMNAASLTSAFSAPSSVLYSSGQHHERQHYAPAFTQERSHATELRAFQMRDADMMEELIGGERYEMVPLPDSMVDTTLFVGNLNEFVKDGDLSDFFQTVSKLQSVPACVCRRPNFDSLGYGFVTFPTVEEKETALMRFHGCAFFGKNIKVEEIRDHPKMGRVRVPEKMVAYVSGSLKKTRSGKANTMRRISRLDDNNNQNKKKKQMNHANSSKKKKTKKKKRKTIKLSGSEQAEFERAIRKGYVTLESTGYRQGRKSSPLACAHREWCDEHEKPQIVLCKASGGRPLDNIIVDLSTLRVMGDEDFLLHHKIEILSIATNSGMELRAEIEEGGGDENTIVCSEASDGTFHCVMTMESNENDDAAKHISKIPVQSLGVFEGQRSQAKIMSRDLARLWDIPVQVEATVTSERDRNLSREEKTNRYKNQRQQQNKRKANHRRRDRRSRDISAQDLYGYL